MKYADLHVHTFYSDSTFSPKEVAACAKDKGLDAIAICDHDSVDGIEPCEKEGSELDIEIIPGIELTVEKPDTEAHILGYFIDWKTDWFQKRLKELQNSRVERIYEMVERLKGFRIDIVPENVFELGGKGSIGRLHLAQAMLKTGKIKNLKEAFDKYIGFSKPCYVPNVNFSSQEAIEIILKVGGVPVLAHPAVMDNDNYIQEFIGYGLRGIEVYHTDHKHSVVRRYEELAKRFDLVMTGGSDCHGLGKGRVLMGSVRVSYEVVEKLKQEARKVANEYR